jgi:multidrug transporter EmrE-like cation transporter
MSLYNQNTKKDNLKYIKWPIMASFVSALYFFLIKEYTKTNKTFILGYVIILQLLIIYLYYKSLQNIKSGILFALINGLSVVIGAIIAHIYYKESYTKNDILGILFIITGIIIVGK